MASEPRRYVLVVKRPGGSESTFSPSSWPVLVGRAPENSLVLADDVTISQRHLSINLTSENRLFVQDLGSTNGTKVNGKDIGSLPYDLRDGDVIQVGKTRITVLVPKTGAPLRPRSGKFLDSISRAARNLLQVRRGGDTLPPGIVRCPNCNAGIHVGNRPAGQRIGCPRCRTFFIPDGR